MSFISKLLKKPSDKKAQTENAIKEESKSKCVSKKMLTKSKSKKSFEKEATLKKVNVCSVYNKNENFKSINWIKGDQTDYKTLYQKKTPEFTRLLDEDITNVEALRKLAWQGIPYEQRPLVWKILLNYAPINKSSRDSIIGRRREEYAGFVEMYFANINNDGLDENDKKALKLVKDDVHRTQPDYPIFRHKLLQDLMLRLLYIFHVRHPASGYVQGINDLTTPFIAVFLREYIDDIDYNTLDVPANFEARFTPDLVAKVEADTYWCLCKILDGILDNYTFSQSGTQKALDNIRQITKKIDSDLFKHLQKRGVDFSFFSFRWVFCLLVREFPLKVGLRLFDTYIADENGFSILHSYVCSALLLKWAMKLKKMSFTDIMLFLQNMPTKEWSEIDLEMTLAEAYVFRTLYEGTYTSTSSTCSNTPTDMKKL